MKIPRPTTSPAAFSLVETAIAIGIIAFAFVGLLALLPLGLASFRGSVDVSIGAQLFQKVVSDAEQADFDRLTSTGVNASSAFYVLPTRYFDDQGVEIVLRTPGHPSPFEGQQIVYQVRVRGSVPGPNEVGTKAKAGFTSLPAVTDAKRFRPRDTTFLTIQIAHHPGTESLPVDDRFLWEEPRSTGTGSISLATYSAIVTRNGYVRQEAGTASNP